MFFYIFQLVPATIFLFFFMNDRRRLINAYLFSISFGLFLLISALLLVVRTGLWFNQKVAIIIFSVLAILVLLSIIFSTVFLLFNGRQMISFEGKRLANLLSLLYGIFIIGALALHSLFPRERSLDLSNRLCPLLLDFSLSILCFIWDFLQLLPRS